MKYTKTVASVMLMLGFFGGSAEGQAGSPGVKVSVPFRFVIGSTTFSAGNYSIFSSRDKVWVQEAGGRNIAVLFTEALDGRVPEKNGKVIFDCYAGECFLSQVWVAGQEAGRSLPKSKQETQLASTATRQEFALLGTKP